MDKNLLAEVTPELASSIGRFVVFWSMVEMALNQWIAIIYQAAGGKHIEPRIPFPLQKRMRFLRQCLNQVSALQPFAAEGAQLISRIEALKNTREMLAHGCLSGHERVGEEDRFLFTRLDLNRDKTEVLPNHWTDRAVI
jgi:hypothetical protein